MQQLNVFISVKPKPRQPIQSVIIKSIEQNMQCMYQARMMLLECTAAPSLSILLDTPPLSGERGMSPGTADTITVIPEHPEEEANQGQPLKHQGRVSFRPFQNLSLKPPPPQVPVIPTQKDEEDSLVLCK